MDTKQSQLKIAVALAAVYVVWGSTYLAIRFAVETLPPFLMASSRFLLAGGALYAWARLRGAPAPTKEQWKGAGIVGSLLLLGANGCVVWAELYVSSALAALLVSTVPLWMALLEWLRTGVRPSGPVLAGVAIGFAGVAILVDPSGSSFEVIPAAVVSLAAVLWAAGSLYGRTAPAPSSALMGTAMQMLCGGAGLLLASIATGEPGRVDVSAMSFRSLAALGYLVVFGSLVGFTAYSWLMRNAKPSLVSTYAYVNPVVAVLLGWLFAGEPLGPRTIVASLLIVGAVLAISVTRVRRAVPRAQVELPGVNAAAAQS